MDASWARDSDDVLGSADYVVDAHFSGSCIGFVADQDEESEGWYRNHRFQHTYFCH
jgi:hypothetical protein